MFKLYTRQRIIVVSLFSGIDLFMLGLTKNTGVIPGYACEWNFSACLMHRANFLHPDGTPVMEPFIPISREEYDALKADDDTKDTVGIIDGQYYRTKWIQEVDGRDIRRAIEARYGKNIILLAASGPPCQLLTSLAVRGRKGMAEDNPGEKNSRHLIFEYLRILKELCGGEGNGNVVGLMEEVPELKEKQFEKLYEEFIEKAKTLPFHFAEQPMCSTHYGGNQMRLRYVMQFVHKSYNTLPVFPEPDTVNVKRVKDFLDIDRFLSGHFIDTWKTKNHFMCTVTKGSPKEFEKAGKKRSPTWDELILCFDVEPGDYTIPPGISATQLRQGIANAVCVSLANALAKTIIEKVLRLKHIGDGYFVPIDTPTDELDGISDITTYTPVPTGGDAGALELPGTETDNPSVTVTDEVQVSTEGQATATVNEAVVLSDAELKPEPSVMDTDPTKAAADYTGTFPDSAISTTDGESEKPPLAISNPEAKQLSLKPIKYYESGYELWRGQSLINGADIVAILTLHSENRKTGDMAQLWILTADMDPIEAMQTGQDEAICGTCKLRPAMSGGCYVYVGQSPHGIWKAWRNGAYPKLPKEYYTNLAGLSVRFGAYGDPAAIPFTILTELKKHIANHTGYTHQWRREEVSELRQLNMASVESIEGQKQAEEMGWRTFRIIRKGDPLLPGEILCPNLTSGVQCKKCTLCQGTSRRAKNIAVHVHGPHKSKFNPSGEEKAPALEEMIHEIKSMPPLRNIITTDTAIRKPDSPKIISSKSLLEMRFQCLHFDGQWLELFGLPSVNFHGIIHGMSGKGKSTFAIQFSSYLADNFGRVLYISGEEGFSKTFRDKFVNTGAASDALDVADLRSFDDIMREVPRDSYNFLVLDSLNTLKIETTKLRKLKATFPNTAFITIAQATKKGEMRGSYEIMHDSDIAVEVTDGIAETTKNRFKETGMTFNVFGYINALPNNL